MGTIQHHAIVVTGHSPELGDAQATAKRAFGEELVSELLISPANGFGSFLVAPDGSKDGWPASDKGDSLRDAFCAYLERSHLSWAEVSYGELGHRAERASDAWIRDFDDAERATRVTRGG